MTRAGAGGDSAAEGVQRVILGSRRSKLVTLFAVGRKNDKVRNDSGFKM